MRLEQTIRDTVLSESMDMDARLQQLVRAGLMPQNTLPLLRKSIAKVQMGAALQGPERDVMATFINSMMYIVLGDDTIFNKARAGAKTYATEAKEKQEYDYEGDMAMSQLKSIIANSQQMHDMLSADTNLPEWVQSKITLAEDYITTASNYMQGEMNEERIDELSRATVGRYSMKAKSIADNEGGKDRTKSRELAGRKKWGGTMSGVKPARVPATEEVEQVDEISKATLGSYVKKASGAEQPKNVMSPKNVPLTKIAAYQGDSETGHFGKRFNQHTYDKAERLRKNRETGIKRAVDKLTKEEVEQVHEISKAMAGRYVKKAAASIDLTAWRQGYKEAGAGNPSKHLEKKLSKRHKGIETAVKKLTREDAEQIDEAGKQHIEVTHVTGQKSKKPVSADNAFKALNHYKSLSTTKSARIVSEDAEQIDELSKDTMGRYIKKAATKIGTQGVTAGLKIAKDERSQKNFDTIGKRERGISTAVKKLTKEDIDAVKKMNESYKTAFETALNEYGIKSPSELDEAKRKEFFNHVDQEYKKGDN
jgi:hypothetical protein